MVPFNVYCGSCYFCARGLYSSIQNGYLKPNDIVTHRIPLEHIAEGYPVFSAKLDGCIKPIILPNASSPGGVPKFDTSPTGAHWDFPERQVEKCFSEGRAAHWLLLIGADRVGTTRVDRSHTWIDPILVTGPWALAGRVSGEGGSPGNPATVSPGPSRGFVWQTPGYLTSTLQKVGGLALREVTR